MWENDALFRENVDHSVEFAGTQDKIKQVIDLNNDYSPKIFKKKDVDTA